MFFMHGERWVQFYRFEKILMQSSVSVEQHMLKSTNVLLLSKLSVAAATRSNL